MGRRVAHINQSAALLQEMRDFLNEEAEHIREMYVVEKSDGIQLYSGVWEECHEVVQREVLHKAIGQVAGSKRYHKKHVESVRNLYFSQVGRYVELPYQVLAERNYHGILLRKETEKKRADNTFLIEIPKESLQKSFLMERHWNWKCREAE